MEEVWDFFKSQVQKHGICNSGGGGAQGGGTVGKLTPQITTSGRTRAASGEV